MCPYNKNIFTNAIQLMSIQKVHIKKVRNTLLWSLLIAGIGFVLYLSVQRKEEVQVDDLVVDIIPIHGDESIITEKEVRRLVRESAGMDIKGKMVRKLPLRKIEAQVQKDKRIKRADIYVDSKNKLHVRIEQKQPIMRIMETTGLQYYLDLEGQKVPVTTGSAVRVPLITGFSGPYREEFLAAKKPSPLKDAFQVVRYISQDPFLEALIEQIHLEKDTSTEIILVPKVGKEQILLGDAGELEEKFEKLKIFYRDGMPRLGWQRYKKLNLKVAGQVVGTLTEVALAERKAYEQDSLQASLSPLQDFRSSESIHH